MNRRLFTLAATAATMPLMSWSKEPPFRALGACAPLAKAGAIKAAGGTYVEEAVRRLLIPEKPNEDWAESLEAAKACPLPIAGCNGFLPGNLRSTGKDANHEAVLAYAQTAFLRAKQLNLDYIVFGSSGSRKLKEGDSKEDAERQFVALLKMMAPFAEQNGITIAVEPLRRQECNFINTMLEGAAIVEKIDHPNIRIVCDIYHMLQNGEDPNDIRRVGHLIHHCHIAEKEKRSAPGVMGDDFGPFFAALKSIDYQGRISVEGKWTPEDLPLAYATIRMQAGEV